MSSALSSKAEEIISNNSDYKTQLLNAIQSRSLKLTLQLSSEKAIEQKDLLGISNTEVPDLAYQLFLCVFGQSNIPENMRNSMMTTVEAKLKEVIPGLLKSTPMASSNVAPAPPILREKAPPVSSPSPSPPTAQIFSTPDPDRIDRSKTNAASFSNSVGSPIQRNPTKATSSAPSASTSNRTVEVNKSVQITCHKCKWLYSSRNESCPMCGAAILLGEDALIKFLAEYVDRQGLTIDPKEAKEFIVAYKKNYKKLPSLDDLWNAAVQLAKLESMNEAQLKKAQQEKSQREKLNLQGEMERLKDKKLKEKEDIEAEKRRQEELKKAAEIERKRLEAEAKAAKMVQIITCKKCGVKNPSDSKFCLECGGKLS